MQVLTSLKESKLQHTEQPQLFLSMHIAQHRLVQGQAAETKPALEEAKGTLASLHDVRSTSVDVTWPLAMHCRLAARRVGFSPQLLRSIMASGSATAANPRWLRWSLHH
jgi:hypothetical protein